MKILQICPHPYEEGMGGVSEYVRNISKILAENNDVTVFATDPRGTLPKYEVIDNVHVERYKRWAPGRAYYFSIELLRKLKKDKYDLVHSHSYVTFPFQISFLSQHKKLVYSTHMHEFPTTQFRRIALKFYNYIGKNILKKANKIIAVSFFEKMLLINNFGMNPDKISVIPCGINYDEFNDVMKNKKSRSVSSPKNILFVGRLHEDKGVRSLIEVMPYLKSDVNLTLVGRGPLKGHLVERSRQLNISNRIKFKNQIPRKELLKLYHDADLFVLLSRHEAYSLSVAEALMSRVPCIVSNTSALTEWIDDVNCYGIEYPIDIIELSEKINCLLEKNLKVDIGNFLGVKIKDWRDVVKELENIYLDLF